jgi:hypothetical protein
VLGDSGAYGLRVGVLSSGDVFQQVDRFDGSATAYNLLLQPRGGKVGIGVTSASQTLHISGADATEPAIGTAPSAGVSILGGNGSYGLYIGQNGSTGTTWLQSMRNDSAVAYALGLQPSGGNVGVGTSTPLAKLAVVGTAGDNPILDIATSTSTSVMRITPAGKVGINTTTPVAVLAVQSLGGNNKMFDVASSTGVSVFTLQPTGTTTIANLNQSACDVKATTGGDLYCGTDATGASLGNAAFTLGLGLIYNATSTDEVGIGFNAPTATLHIQGNDTTDLFQINSSTGITLLKVSPNGSVGIGTTTDTASPAPESLSISPSFIPDGTFIFIFVCCFKTPSPLHLLHFVFGTLPDPLQVSQSF